MVETLHNSLFHPRILYDPDVIFIIFLFFVVKKIFVKMLSYRSNYHPRESDKNFFFIIFLCLLYSVDCYNFDTDAIIVWEDPKIFRNSRASYFGFSTALYPDSEKNFQEASILVGAPRANVSSIPSVIEPGTVYKCLLNGTCDEWNLDPTKNGHINRNSNINQIKDNAWIGGSIGVENKIKPKIVVCGPRWKNNIINANLPNWFMNGICYWSTALDSTTFKKQAENRIIPLLGLLLQITATDNVRAYNYGMGEAGFSLHMYTDRNKSSLMLGNPGVFNWKGTPLITDFVNRGKIPKIGTEPLIRSGDYFGYAVTSGFYFKPGDRWSASGAPRGGDMTGLVLIFRFSDLVDKRLEVRKVLEGEQHGEYFGSSLTSCDVNNDGRDEIIVGAPLWSRFMDEGRVYVYLLKSNGVFEPQILEGEVIGARFGTVVTCLGDVDYDGYGDIAVGAPYEDDHGSVYIYNGNSDGISKRYSQRITGETVSPNIRGFGGSISEARDLDGNAYADVAIGAYSSGHVALLRSRPVVTMKVSVTYLGAKELQSNSTFFLLNVCSFYDGSHVPEKLNVIRTLKVDAQQGRAFYGNEKHANGTYHIPDILQRGKNICQRVQINLIRGIQNVIDPIEISVHLDISNSSTSFSTSENLVKNFCSSCPVMNEALSKSKDSITLPFAVDCGDDNVCTSIIDLSISGDFEDGNRYTLGSKPTVKFAIEVDNRGEPAYKAQSHIFIPSPISLGSVPPECTEKPRLNGILEVTCELGNPLRNRKISILELDMRMVGSDTGNVELSTKVSTQSLNINSAKDTRNMTIYFDVDVDIAIAGKSQEDLYSYFNKDEEKPLEIIRFQHIYEVQKFGKSPIDESIMTILVPTHWKDEDESIIEIARVNKTFGIMDGRKFYCTDSSHGIDGDVLNEMILSESLIIQNSSTTERPNLTNKKNHTFERFSIEENPSMNVPPDNRTLYLNCTNSMVTCTQITCKLGTFANSLTVAKLSINLDMQLKNFRRETMEAKDIIFFVSNGSIVISQPSGIVQRIENKPDSTLVGTTFVGSPIASRIAVWIIVLSVLLGILLLVLLTLGLVRFGFFHRKKREELEALKAESDKDHGFVLETSSSREVLDQD